MAEDAVDVEVVVVTVEADSEEDSVAVTVVIAVAVEASVEAVAEAMAIVTGVGIGVGEGEDPEGVEATEVHVEEADTEEMAATSARIVHEAAARITAIHRPLGIPFKNKPRKKTNEKRLLVSL